MKQKMVIKLSINNDRCRAKAMKIAVGVEGVNSANVQMDKDLIEVAGDDVDAVRLANQLRKYFKYAELVSLNPVGEKKEPEKKPDPPTKKEPEVTIQYPICQPPPYCVAYEPPYPDSPSICSIM